jgi:hypothetical protein
MKQKIMKAWVKALRSGKYKQARSRLRRVNDKGETMGFCCLGVLCNLHAQAHPAIARAQTNRTEYLGESSILPKKVMEWAGLGDECGLFKPVKGTVAEEFVDCDGQVDLTVVNDSADADFKAIAKMIQANWRRL